MAVGKSELQILINAKDNASKGLGRVTKGVTALGAAAAAAGVASVKLAADFDKGMREVATLTPDVADNLDEMKSQVLDLSTSLGVNAVDATGALYQAISAGVPTDNAISFLEVASKAAIGGVTDTETAVDGLTTVMNAFAGQNIDAQQAADVMFATVKAGKTDFAQLSDSMFQVAPLANAAGVSFEEVSAGMATLTAQGTPTRVATTQLRAAIQGLTRPSDEMTAIFQEAGFASGELAVKQLGLKGAADVVTNATGGSISSMTKLLGSIEGVQAILGVTGDNADAFAKNVKGMADAGGAADKAFEEMEKSASRNFEKMKVQVMNLAIRIGEKLLPVINKVLEFLLKLEGPGKTVAMIVGGIAAAFGVLMVALGPLLAMKGLFGAILAFTKIGAVIPIAIGAVKLLGAALLAVLGPIGLVIAGAVAVGVVVNKLADKFGWFGRKAEDAQDATEKVDRQFFELTETSDQMVQGLDDIATKADDFASQAKLMRLETDLANDAMFDLKVAGIDPAGEGMGLTAQQAGDLRLAMADLAEAEREAEEAAIALEAAQRELRDTVAGGISALRDLGAETDIAKEIMHTLATHDAPTLTMQLGRIYDGLIAAGIGAKEAAKRVQELAGSMDSFARDMTYGMNQTEAYMHMTEGTVYELERAERQVKRTDRQVRNYTRGLSEAEKATRRIDDATSDLQRALESTGLEADLLSGAFQDFEETGIKQAAEGFDLLKEKIQAWGEATGKEYTHLMDLADEYQLKLSNQVAAEEAAEIAEKNRREAERALRSTRSTSTTTTATTTTAPAATAARQMSALEIVEARARRQQDALGFERTAFELGKARAQISSLSASDLERLRAGTLSGVSFGEGMAFQRGGSFVVPGSGGPDSQHVNFRASPGERVSISRPGDVATPHQTIIVQGSVITERQLATLAVNAMRKSTRLNEDVLRVGQVVQ